MKPLLNLLVAHKPEAKPLLSLFGLREVMSVPHPVYCNDEGLCLAVSGNGSAAMAEAVAFLAGLQSAEGAEGPAGVAGAAPAWLNVGIAGHGSAAVGEGVLINKIQSSTDSHNYYPTPLASSPSMSIKLSGLKTVHEIERDYPESVAYDMEGAAFWRAAIKYGALDNIQLFKIVSDNPEQHVDQFSLDSIPALFGHNKDQLRLLVEGLLHSAARYREHYDLPEELGLISAQFRLTATQQSQLKQLLQQGTTLSAHGSAAAKEEWRACLLKLCRTDKDSLGDGAVASQSTRGKAASAQLLKNLREEIDRMQSIYRPVM